MSPTDWALALTVAPLVGFLGMFSGGFWGVGCGWLIVPTMLVFFDCTPMQAAGIGLLQMAPSILGTVLKDVPKIQWNKGAIGGSLVIPMALGALITSFCGLPINLFFHKLCGSTAILSFFGLFMLWIGYKTLWGKTKVYSDGSAQFFTLKSSVLALLCGFGAGVFSSVLGVGGAMVFRPALTNGFKIPEQEVARNVRFLLLTTTLTGGLIYLFSSNGIDIKILILSVAIAVGGAIGFPLGAKVHQIIVQTGYARIAQRSFAIICAVVVINVSFLLVGWTRIGRIAMFVAAILIPVFLLAFLQYAKKRPLK